MKIRHFLMKGNNRVEEKKERKVNFDGDQKMVMKAEGGNFSFRLLQGVARRRYCRRE